VQRVAFDPIDPTVIYAVLGGFDGALPGDQGHVFRTTVASTRWTDISPPVDIPMGAIALDATTTPATIAVYRPCCGGTRPLRRFWTRPGISGFGM